MLKSMCEGSEAQRPRFPVPPAPLTPVPRRYRELEWSERLSWPRPGSCERRGPGEGTGEAALGWPPWGLRAVPTVCHRHPRATVPGERPASAECRVGAADGIRHGAWALQEATGALGGAGP